MGRKKGRGGGRLENGHNLIEKRGQRQNKK